ncbi:unnamed protein product, partial [marine sediment metagenome]
MGSVSGAVGSVTGHTNQSGDSFAIVNGDHGLVSIQDDVDNIPTTTEFGLRSLLAAEYTIVADLGVVQSGDSFARIGALGVGLTAITDKTGNLPADPASETNVDANETKIDTVKAETALIVADTNELQTDNYPTSIAAVQTTVDAIETTVITNAAGTDIAADIIALKAETVLILADTGTTLQGEVDGIQAGTEDIQSRLPAALSGGNMKADVLAISTSTEAADSLEASAETIVIVTAAAGTLSTTQMTTNLTETTDDH